MLCSGIPNDFASFCHVDTASLICSRISPARLSDNLKSAAVFKASSIVLFAPVSSMAVAKSDFSILGFKSYTGENLLLAAMQVPAQNALG